MKVKLVVALAVLFFALQAHADSTPITVDVTSGYCNCVGGPNGTLDLSMQLTVEQVTGEFWFAAEAMLFQQTAYEVLSMTGTLDGQPIALAPFDEGEGSWLATYGDFALGWISFTRDGETGAMFDDLAYDRIYAPGYNGTTITWSAVEVAPTNAPEPTAYAMLMTGLVGLLALRRLLDNSNRRVPSHRVWS